MPERYAIEHQASREAHRGVLLLLATLTIGGTMVAFMSCAIMSTRSTEARSHAEAAATTHDGSGATDPSAAIPEH